VTATSSQVLGAFAAQLTYEDIPREVLEHAKLCLLDTLGCGLFGTTLPWTQIVHDVVAELGDDGRAVVWGTGRRGSCADAALVNGSAVHGFELDDLHQRSIVHPGSVVVPAALAVAEHVGSVDGRRFLTAVVAGYEVAARVGMSVGAAHLIQGWHPTGTHGTLGAAAAAGVVLGLTPDQMAHALGTAGSQSAGLMAAQYSSMVKRLHAGRAAQSGVYSALLAARGYMGIVDLFESEYGGYLRTFSPRHDASKLVVGLGETWETSVIGFKPYSTNGSCHPTIDALLDLRADEGLTAADVATVDIFASTATKEHVGWPYVPNSVTTAQMNLPYIVAAVLTDGDAFVGQFTEERIRDQQLVELAGRVQVHADADVDARGDGARHATRVEVTRKDGVILRDSREFARGSARRPLTAAEVQAKFHKLATTAVAAPDAVRLEQLVQELEKATDVVRLAAALVVDGSSVREESTN
jgi:aconitate decarboxylase